jgi:hypothetical protein
MESFLFVVCFSLPYAGEVEALEFLMPYRGGI